MRLNKHLTRSGITAAATVAVLGFALSACTTLKSGFNQTFHRTDETLQAEEQTPQFIDDFFHDSSVSATSSDRPHASARTTVKNDLADTHASAENTLRQLSKDPGNEAEEAGASIGGLDYEPEGDAQGGAEDLSYFEDLFLATELLEGEKFDPLKMTDTIPVYLVSPWSNCFNIPVPGKINSNFGMRHGRIHTGIDLDLETGDDVVAAFDGIVQKAENYGGYGNLVVMKDFNGLQTYYAHLSKIKVVVGDTLDAGDILGAGGSTGHSTGPHLHFEIRYRGVPIDPTQIVNFTTKELNSDVYYLTKNSFKTVNAVSTGTTGTASKYYTVRKGDSLSKIAAKNKTTVSKLCKLNKISTKKILKPGMKLRVR